MNKVILTGRITHDLQLRYTSNNKPVCNFSIAVNEPVIRDGERKTDFIDCVVWGKSAENLVNYQNKGSLIGVHGKLKREEYELEGSKRYKTFVLVDEVEFMEKRTSENKTEISNTYADFGTVVSIDEEGLPF